MTDEQGGAAQAPGSATEVAGRPGADEQTISDGAGGVITKTAPSSAGESYAGGTIVENDVGESQEELMAAIEATIKPSMRATWSTEPSSRSTRTKSCSTSDTSPRGSYLFASCRFATTSIPTMLCQQGMR
jgi:hypothetical protein